MLLDFVIEARGASPIGAWLGAGDLVFATGPEKTFATAALTYPREIEDVKKSIELFKTRSIGTVHDAAGAVWIKAKTPQ